MVDYVPRSEGVRLVNTGVYAYRIGVYAEGEPINSPNVFVHRCFPGETVSQRLGMLLRKS